MIKNDAIAIAEKLVKAQARAKEIQAKNGVMFFKDANKTEFVIIPVDELLLHGESLGETIKDIHNNQTTNSNAIKQIQDIIRELDQSVKNIIEQIQDILTDVAHKIDDIENIGDPL